MLLSTVGLSAQTTISARAATITIGGRLHTQYAMSSLGSYTDDFFFRRARLIADVSVNDFFDARIQPEFAGSGGAELKDAYVRFKFSPAFRVSMGQFKRPFDLFELASSTDLSLIERDGRVGGAGSCAGVGGICSYSRLTERLGYADRDTGVRAEGGFGRIAYQVALINGAGANTTDTHDAKSYSGRVVVRVADGLSLGGQVALHDYAGPGDEDRHAPAWAADLQYGTWRDGLLLQAAAVSGDNWRHLDAGGDATTFVAYQAVASYYAPLRGERLAAVEPLVRVSWADPDTATADDGGVIFTPGFMFYVAGKNKIGLNVDVWSPQAGDTEYSMKIQSFLYF